MWQSFTAKNFRGFREVTLSNLGRVNLIAGKNNTGKTALLEAIQIYSYPQNCELPFTINELREASPERRIDPETASWLFHNRDTSELTLRSQDSEGEARTLQMCLGDHALVSKRFPEADKFVVGSFLEGEWNTDLPRLVLKTTAADKEFLAVALLTRLRSLASISSKQPWKGPSFLLSSWRHFPKEDVKAFSELEMANRQHEILPTLRLLEPRLVRLSLLLVGGEPVLHADIGLGRLVPLTIMGEGIRRLLSMLAAITTAEEGRVLVDEIDNGLHYSVLKNVWLAIAHAARRADVQVFATTHSWECIQAAHQAFKACGPYDFRYHRLDRADGAVVVKTFDERMLDAVEKTDLEVR